MWQDISERTICPVVVWPPGFFAFWELSLKFDLLSRIARMCILAFATAIS
jgi:hypothetical protein